MRQTEMLQEFRKILFALGRFLICSCRLRLWPGSKAELWRLRNGGFKVHFGRAQKYSIPWQVC